MKGGASISMADNVCQITIDGSKPGDYYVPCNQVQYLSSNLVNTGSSTIYLYDSLDSSNTRSAAITIPALSYPYYISAGSYNTRVYITNITDVRYNLASQFYRLQGFQYQSVSLVLMFLVVLCLVFRRH